MKTEFLKKTIFCRSAGVLFLLGTGFCSCPGAFAGTVKVTSGSREVIQAKADKQSGLNDIFVVYDTDGLSISFTPLSPNAKISWTMFSNLGGGYATETSFHQENGVYILDKPKAGIGYIVEEEGLWQYTFWIVNYADNKFEARDLQISPNQECGNSTLLFSGNATPIRYTGINGRQFTLDRELEICYQTLEWDNSARQFINKENNLRYESLSGVIQITPPAYCRTNFTLTGDCFLSKWGMPIQIESEMAEPHSVLVETEAEQTSEKADNQMNSNVSTELGGSAPADISFTAYTTDGVEHDEWQISDDENFENILYRFNQKDLDFTFDEEGQFFVRFIGSNADGSCESIGTTYNVAIGASELKCPNAFSPDGDGVNDEWKVSYRSLVEFECWIFDRQGRQLYHSRRPDEGWDGKRGGKTVSPGVYYYVIDAKGADGRKYKKSGDINILRYKLSNSTQTVEP